MKKVVYKTFLFLFILFHTYYSSANPQQYTGKSLTISNGLLSNKIKVVYQDKEGFIWFGSANGLSRYDGYNFLNYEYEPHKENCLSNSNIEDLVEDANGNLYVGTNNGLNLFQKSKQTFSIFPVFRNGIERGIKVNSLTLDDKQNLWIASTDGLYVYDTKRKHFIDSISGNNYKDEVKIAYADKEDNVWAATSKNIYRYTFKGTTSIRLTKVVLQDNKYSEVYCIRDIGSGILISTDTGIYLYSYADDKLRTINISHATTNTFIGEITDIYIDKKNTIWLGSINGIYYADKLDWKNKSDLSIEIKVKTFKNYFSVKKIYPDSKGNIWVNSSKEGILVLYPSNINAFTFHKHHEKEQNSLNSNYINTVSVDKDGKLYVGTDGGGLNSHNKNTNKYIRLNNDIPVFENIDVSIMSTFVDNTNTLWFGTYDNSLYSYSTENGLLDFSDKISSSEEAINIPTTSINELNNTIIIGTGGNGLFTINKTNAEVKNFKSENSNISNNYITCMYKDKRNRLWIGTYWGLNLFDITNNKNKHFTYDKNYKLSLSNNAITTINEDTDGNIWVGTEHGLNKLNEKDATFITFTKTEGLASNAISAIECDNNKQLWISTQRGLCRLNIASNTIESIRLKSQKNIVEFSANASAKSKNGMLYFGSNEGLIAFNPNNIINRIQNNKMVITDIKLFNQSILGNKDILSNTNNSGPTTLTLNHKQSVLSIEFASLNYTNATMDEFTYFLEGFDSKWQDAGIKRMVTYTNLKAGEYTFHVKQSKIENADETTLIIKVLPPFWKTWYALLFYTLIITLLIQLYLKYSIIRVNVKNDLLIQKIQRAKDQEIHDMKLKFFTNISHEFCTPLTLIIAPLEKLKAEDKSNTLYDLILKNAHRLLRLIDQLMEFRMIESDTMTLNKQNNDIVGFTHEIYLAFNDLATKKEIKYEFMCDHDHIQMWFDRDKMEKILYNLFSNAFKYSADKSKISVTIALELNMLHIKVQDTGIGISDENLPYIYDRFYHAKNNSNLASDQSSFGVGLALTKTLAELHNGKIRVNSKLNKGTTFTLSFPIIYTKKEDLGNSTNASNDALSAKVKSYLNYDFYTHKKEAIENTNDAKPKEQSILIVEDNNDIRTFLMDLLATKFKTYEAINGKEGLALATKHDIDLIISDVLMPVMDGITLCKEIKKDVKTSHIPILMLTALHAKDHVLEGLKSGASDYITKPFDPLILNTKIENILLAQENLQNKFKNDLIIQPSEVTTNTKDEVFLKQAIAIIENNLSNEKLSVEMLAQELNITSISLYRKIKKISALSTNEFIRSIKLKKAALQLKADPNLTINEVSFMVGFNDVQYFRQCFKKEFGVNPNEFKKSSN